MPSYNLLIVITFKLFKIPYFLEINKIIIPFSISFIFLNTFTCLQTPLFP